MSYQCNGLGDLIQFISFDIGMVNSIYDVVGNLFMCMDSCGVLVIYGYDNFNWMMLVVFMKVGQMSQVYGWIYDQMGGDFIYGIGCLMMVMSLDVMMKYSYDVLGCLVIVSQVVGVMICSMCYGYDGVGNIMSIIYLLGCVFIIVYDNGKLMSVSVVLDVLSVFQFVISQIQFEFFGGVCSWLMYQVSGMKVQECVYDLYGCLVCYLLGLVV